MRLLMIGAVVALGSSTLVLGPAATAADSYTVTSSVSATSVDVGQGFTVRGHVSPVARGEYAVVQRRVGTGWTRVARDAINRYGNYRATVAVTEPGDSEYRVLKRHSRGHLRGVSATFTVTGWRWRALNTMPTYGTSTNIGYVASGSLGTLLYPVTYAPLIKMGTPNGSVSYVLAQKCSRFEGDVGVTTDSTADGDQMAILGTFAEAAPGSPTQILGQTLHRNQDPAHVVRSGTVISDAWGLNLTAEVAAGDYVGWGGAKVYCKS